MCLAIPGKIVAIKQETTGLEAQVDYSGVIRIVSLDFIPEAQVNEYVLVHAGFAIAALDEQEAQATIAEFQQDQRQDLERKQ